MGTRNVRQDRGYAHHTAESEDGGRDDNSEDEVGIVPRSALVKEGMEGDGSKDDLMEQVDTQLPVGNSFRGDGGKEAQEVSCMMMVDKGSGDYYRAVLSYMA